MRTEPDLIVDNTPAQRAGRAVVAAFATLDPAERRQLFEDMANSPSRLLRDLAVLRPGAGNSWTPTWEMTARILAEAVRDGFDPGGLPADFPFPVVAAGLRMIAAEGIFARDLIAGFWYKRRTLRAADPGFAEIAKAVREVRAA